jgi:SAM-dependent methyltransferase
VNTLLKKCTLEEFCRTYRQSMDDVRRGLTLIADAKASVGRLVEGVSLIPRDLSDYHLAEPDKVADEWEKHAEKSVWSELINLCGVRSVMTEILRRKLDTDIRTGDVPPITPEAIDSFITALRGDMPTIIDEAIKEAARVLRPQDRQFVTNGDGWALGEKAIVTYAVQWESYCGFSLSYHRDAALTAIDNAFHLLDGKGVAKHPDTLTCSIRSAMQAGMQFCETPYFRVKFFKNGNAHFTFLRLDLVDALNAKTSDNRTLRDANDAKRTNRKTTRTVRREYSDLNFFPTPPELAKRLVQMADVAGAKRILEPSAGDGAILSEITSAARRAKIVAIELDADRARRMRGVDHEKTVVVCMDFMDYEPDFQFDRIIANPPFSMNRDTLHLQHMVKLLAPGGRLVCVLPGSFPSRRDPVTTSFRSLIGDRAVIEPLPDDSFKSSGTGVSTVVLTYEKPAVAEQRGAA